MRGFQCWNRRWLWMAILPCLMAVRCPTMDLVECGPLVDQECGPRSACEIVAPGYGQCVPLAQVDGTGLCGGPAEVVCEAGYDCAVPDVWPYAVGICQPTLDADLGLAPASASERVAVGEPCGPEFDRDCSAGSACHFLGSSGFGVCVATDQIDGVGFCAGPEQVPCSGDYECGDLVDWPNAVAVCVRTIPSAAEDAPGTEPIPPTATCGPSAPEGTNCGSNQLCQIAAGAALGICVEGLQVDGIVTCAGPDAVACADGFRCVFDDLWPNAVGFCVDANPPPPAPWPPPLPEFSEIGGFCGGALLFPEALECVEGAACQLGHDDSLGTCVAISDVRGLHFCAGPAAVPCAGDAICEVAANWPDAVGVCEDPPQPPPPVENGGLCGPLWGDFLTCEAGSLCLMKPIDEWDLSDPENLLTEIMGRCREVSTIDGIETCGGPENVTCSHGGECYFGSPDAGVMGWCVAPPPPPPPIEVGVGEFCGFLGNGERRCVEGAVCQMGVGADHCIEASSIDGIASCGGPEAVACANDFECVIFGDDPDAAGTCRDPDPPPPFDGSEGDLCGPPFFPNGEVECKEGLVCAPYQDSPLHTCQAQ